MIESIELRNPYLDVKFLKYILNINIEKIYNNWNNYQKTGKFILKKLAYKKYAKDFGDEYFLNKEGTRNYSYYVSDKKFWNLNNFISVNHLDKEFNYYDDWRFFL